MIYDEDGLYDPKEFNDRLVLGLKGTMSEAELHVLKSRLQGGLRSKARRGELKVSLPVGLVYQADNRVALDPDQAIQAAVRLVFETFARTGSAWKTVRYFVLQHLTFPRRLRYGPHKGEVVWGPLNHNRVRKMLHNPRYAGAFCYGRTHVRYTGDHKVHIEQVPLAEWLVLIPDAHPGYITWEQYQHHQGVLRTNAQAFDAEDGARPPREGSALLQGLVLCGRCGQRMMTHYRLHRGQRIPEYLCEHERVKGTAPLCQYVPGRPIDAAVGALVVDLISPDALQMVLAVQEEFGQQVAQVDQLRRQTIERARYESDLAHRRYLQVDPENRLVAFTLEHDWNDKLQTLQDLEQAYARCVTEDPRLSPTDQAAVAALATDIPRLWANPATPMRERKRLVRLVIADVTLLRDETAVHVGIRLRSGHTRTLDLPRPQSLADQRRIPAEAIARIDALLDTYTDGGVVQVLNADGIRPSLAESFTPVIVRYVRRTYHLASRKQRLLQQGWLTQDDVAATLHISKYTVQSWRQQGLLRAVVYSDKNEYLYAPLTDSRPAPGGRLPGERKALPDDGGSLPPRVPPPGRTRVENFDPSQSQRRMFRMRKHVTYRLPDEVIEDIRYLTFLMNVSPARVITIWIEAIAHAVDTQAGTHAPGRSGRWATPVSPIKHQVPGIVGVRLQQDRRLHQIGRILRELCMEH